MKKTTRLLAAVGLAVATSIAGPVLANENLTQIATDLLVKGLGQGDKQFIMDNVAEDYIQHNPQAQDGRAGLLGFVDFIQSSGSFSPNIIRSFEDGDLVVIQSSSDFGGGVVIFDLFRFEGETIVEHWDGIQNLAPANGSGRTMIDGAVEVSDLDKTEENRELVVNFVTDVLMNGDLEKIPNYIGDIYLQHNPNGVDGAEGLVGMFGFLAANNISFGYTQIHNVVAQGNFVLTQSEGQIGGKTNAFFDLFRVEDGKIVEHWDVVQEVPDEMPHDNGMF